MPPEMTAPPAAPVRETTAPDLPPQSGAKTLQETIREFGRNFKTVADDDPRAQGGGEPPPATLTEAVEGEEGGAAEGEAAPSASAGPVQGPDGRWRNPDGSFAKDPNAPAEDVPETGTDVPKTGTEAAAPETVPFTLKGLSERGEQDVELDVPKEYEERFRRLTNDANRYRDVAKRLDAIEAKEADFRVLEGRMASNPSEFVLTRLAPEVQQQMAIQLAAQHWDAILPKLIEYADHPEQRVIAAKDNELRIERAQNQWQRQQVEAKAEAQALRMIEDSIPEGTSDSRANRFRTLAESELKRFYQTNNRTLPTLEQMKTILTDVAADMGFNAPSPAAEGSKAGLSTKPAAPGSRQATGTARKNTVAERQAAAQRSRVVARHTTPAGAGGAPTIAPAIPKTDPNNKKRSPIMQKVDFLRANPGILRATE